MKKTLRWFQDWFAFFVGWAWVATTAELGVVRCLWPGLSRLPIHGVTFTVVAAYLVQNVLGDAGFMLALAGAACLFIKVIRKKCDGGRRRRAARSFAVAACFFFLAFTPLSFALFKQDFMNLRGAAFTVVMMAFFAGLAVLGYRVGARLGPRSRWATAARRAAAISVAAVAALWGAYGVATRNELSLPAARAGRGPNIIVLLIDACRRDALSCYGGAMPTPHIDGVAARGVVFDNAFTTVPNTNRAVMSLFTSRSPTVHGATVTDVAADGIPTVAEALAAAGYDCEAIIGNPVLRPAIGYGKGFRRYVMAWDPIRIRWLDYTAFPGSYRRVLQRLIYPNDQMPITDMVTDEVVSFLANYNGAKPFFLYVHYLDPHNPYTPPVEYLRPPLRHVEQARKKLAADAQYIRKYRIEDAEVLRTLYMGEVAYVDDGLRDIFRVMERRKLWENTVVVITADHGEAFGEHGAMDHHVHYDEVLRVPLIIRAPAGPLSRPGRYEGAVSLLDLAPTFVAFAGAPPLPGAEGKDLASLLLRPEEDRWVYAEGRIRSDEPASLHSRKYAVIEDGERGRVEVYDRQRDPQELNNLNGVEEELTSGLVAALRARREAVKKDKATLPGRAELTGSERKKLRGLGYVN